MGIYINKGNEGFQSTRNSEYIDKSGLIDIVNKTLFTRQRFTCVSRSRRFGKTMAAEMLQAYYDHSCDSRNLFADLEIANAPSFEEHLNKYPVVSIDMGGFVARYREADVVENLKRELREDILEAYPMVEVKASDDLLSILMRISSYTGERFVFIIDEWDAICREYPESSPMMDKYIDWLRRMFKDSVATNVFAGVYMTGILPIKKYNTQSALNNFTEYSVVDPRRMAKFFGFTKDEVRMLATKYGMDFDELEKWYDGYQIGSEQSMFNPNSVIQALDSDWCTSYWGKTAAYDAIVPYIQMNFEGLKDDIITMLAGGRCSVDTTGFQNDLSVVHSKDDVLTILIHLGYLSYDRNEGKCFIPNKEVAGEMEKAVERTNWTHLITAIKKSEALLNATLAEDADAVASGLNVAHDENTSILSYNDENSLACVMGIAYYFAKNDYVMHREYASGKGYADLVLIPRKNVDSPALIIELKFDKDTKAAISQIKNRNYPQQVAEYTGDILLVGINYDKNTKRHECQIERWRKE